MRNILEAPAEARHMLLGRANKRGRRNGAPGAWNFADPDFETPEHPQQDHQMLIGGDEGLVIAGQAAAEDSAHEKIY